MTLRSAGSFDVRTDGRLGFLQNASWLGEKPRLLCSEFFAQILQTRVISTEHTESAITLRTMFSITALCLSTIPFDQGAKAAVVRI